MKKGRWIIKVRRINKINKYQTVPQSAPVLQLKQVDGGSESIANVDLAAP